MLPLPLVLRQILVAAALTIPDGPTFGKGKNYLYASTIQFKLDWAEIL
jgi:hypothetical protein